MHWRKCDLWKPGVAITGMLLLLVVMAWFPVSAARAHEGVSGSATPGTIPKLATPTEDATVTTLKKEQLTQQVAQQQHTWDNWLWSNAVTILSSFFSTLVIVVGALFGLWRWRRDRRDVQDKELKERQNELEKRAEERFQAAVTGLGDEKEGARIGAAILLRTFLRPGYEQFYTQVFDLAVANLRLPRTSQPPDDPNAALPLTTLSQALIVVFKEAFPLARSQNEENSQFLDASRIQLDNAHIGTADLKRANMRQASLRNVNFFRATLRDAVLFEANLGGASLQWCDLSGTRCAVANLSRTCLFRVNLSGADLLMANLSGADLRGANLSKAFCHKADLSGANLSKAYSHMGDLSEGNLSKDSPRRANLSGADLSEADLSEADLSETNIEEALSLRDTDLRGVKGLTKEQLEACKAKGAIIDEDPTTSSSQSVVTPPPPLQSNGAQTPSASSAQGSLPTSDAGGSSVVSSQQDSES